MSALFKRISIKNFKNIQEAVLDLQPVNVIVGSNNSGKTNFLYARDAIRALLKGGRDGQESLQESLFRRSIKNDGAVFECDVWYDIMVDDKVFDCKYSVHIERPYFDDTKKGTGRTGHKILIETLEFKDLGAPGPFRNFFRRSFDKIDFGPQVERTFPKDLVPGEGTSVVEILYSLNSQPATELKCILDGLLEFCDSTIFSAHTAFARDFEKISKKLEELYTEKENNLHAYEKFISYFKKALCLSDFDLHKFSVPRAGDEGQPNENFYFCFVKFDGSTSSEALHNLSDGSLLLFQMLFEVIFGGRSLILIDEPEIGLHPKALNELFEFLRVESDGKRVILATHSSYLLNIVDTNCVVVSEMTSNGRVKFSKVTDIPNLHQRLKSKYVNFGDLLVEGFRLKDRDMGLD